MVFFVVVFLIDFFLLFFFKCFFVVISCSLFTVSNKIEVFFPD